MKGGVIHDHEMVGIQTRAQPRLQPGVENPRIAGAIEQHGLGQSPLHASGDERRAGPSLPGHQAVHTLAFGGIPIPPCRRRHKPTFIDVHGVFATAHESLAKAEELFSS